MPELTTPINAPPPFLDPQSLMNASQPVRRFNWMMYAIVVVVTLIGLSLAGFSQPDSKPVLQVLTALVLGAGIISSSVMTLSARKRHLAEVATVEAVDEMIQLRRWEPAGLLLQRFLSQPVKSYRVWARALVQLSMMLSRHHRYDDALKVQSFLIDNELLDGPLDYGVRIGRAMAMLREDHLVDADRAISDVRRRVDPTRSGAGSLLELFRDVKTGHATEAIELFEQRQLVMRDQLGHRMADAHALLALAFDMLGRSAEAAAAYQRATLLAPPAELRRRYQELDKIADRYAPTYAPREAA